MNKVIAFVLGATAGSLITWKLVEKKYKDLADEEIASVVETFKNKYKKEENEVKQFADETKEVTTVNERKEEKKEYAKMINDLRYNTVDKDYTVYVEQGDDMIMPYVIAPDEYGDKVGYDAKTWYYHADGIVADENDEIVPDPENIIGEALEHFGDYDDDSVYVRNDNVKCDYEILKHNQTYNEFVEDDE